MIHIIILSIIIGVTIWLWLGNRKLEKKMDTPLSYYELLWKLKLITNMSEYDIFHAAGKEKKHAAYKVDDDFKRYLNSDAEWLPVYLQQFLEEGREHIIEYKIHKWFV